MSLERVKLADICSFKTGKLNSNAAVEGGAFPFFTCAQETYSIDKAAFNTEAVLLGGNNANGVYPLKYYRGEFNAYQRTYVIETLDEKRLKTRFLYFALRPALSQFQAMSIGAATQYLTKSILDNFEISLPSIQAQDKIIDVLAQYDDLIENNCRRIQLLGESAYLLYREWFVLLRFPGHEHVKIIDGVPEGWKKQVLGNFVEVKKGKNITQETVEAGDIPVVAGGLKPAYYHSKANVNGPVITVSASGANAGYVNFYQQDIWASDCSYINREVDQHIYFRYLQLRNAQVEIFGMQHGAAQPHVYPKDLERLVVYQPIKSLLELFEGFVSDQFELIRKLQAANIQLAHARDILLPRLMNGELAA